MAPGEARKDLCLLMTLESELPRDTSAESSYAEDDWPDEEQREWCGFWDGYVQGLNRFESCHHRVEK